MKVRVMSFNIRNSDGKDGINKWIHRKASVQELLTKYLPDIIGFQEVLPDQMHDLIEMLPEYDGIEAGRDNGTNQGEGVPIFYRKSKYHLISQEKFWMSDNPASPNKHWGMFPRITLLAKFQAFDSSSKAFYIENTHLDHLKESIREKSARLILSKSEPLFLSNPVIIIGDFNAWPNQKTHKRMITKLTDVFSKPPNQRASKEITFHDFTGTTSKKLLHPIINWLDYIFVSEQVQIGRAQVITDAPHTPIYPSDHWPIMCDLEL